MEPGGCAEGVTDMGGVRVGVEVGPEAVFQAGYSTLVRVLSVAAGSRADAEEAAQEAFVRLITHWSTVSAYDDPQAWVRLVAFRLLRKSQRRTNPEPEPAVPVDPALPDLRLDVRRALARVPSTHRTVLVLHYLADLPVDEIARVLKIPTGTVKSRLSRGRDYLTSLLQDGDPDHV